MTPEQLEEGIPINLEYYPEPSSKCIRVQRFIARNSFLNFLLPISVVFILILFVYFCIDFFKSSLLWIESQNSWFIFIIFILLFTIVSFPVTVGYLVLIISSGYLFGIIKGILTVILAANFGVFVAHNTIKILQKRINLLKYVYLNCIFKFLPN